MKTLLRLMVFARKYWLLLVLAFISLIGTTCFGMAVPWVIRKAIDSVIGHGERSFLFLAAAVVIGANLMRGISSFSQMYLAEFVSQKTAYDIRNAIYDQLQRLSFAYHDNTQTGQLMSRATVDVEAIRMLFGRGFLHTGQFLFLFTGIACILISMNWRLALISLSFLPLIGFRASLVSLRLRPIWLRIQDLLGVTGTILEENLIGVRVVKAFCRQEDESRKFYSEADQLYKEEINAARQMAFNMPLMAFLVSLPTALILWYGGLQVIEGNLTIGGLTQFILYLGMMVLPVRRLGGFTNMISRAIPAGQRIIEILDTKSPVREKPDAIELRNLRGAVCFENVTFGYETANSVLKDISFKVKPGELVALVGNLGSGKSTIAHLIPRFYDVDSGIITIDGINIQDATISSLRKNVGIVQQDIFLFSDTIRYNIAYGAVNADMKQIVAASKAAQLHDFIQSLPDGYDTWVGERGITLSGGEKQRVAIARTLLINPSILILDDSTSSVDPEIEHLIRQALGKIISGRTTFIITHRLPIIKNADLILVLHDGRLVQMGRHRDLMTNEGQYKQIYKTQLSAMNNDGAALISE
ncbi:ABC transporter ATP-binding protein [Thermodesulfobacteriota bacterium]